MDQAAPELIRGVVAPAAGGCRWIEGDAAGGQRGHHGRDPQVAEARAEDVQLAVDRLAGHLLADQARAGLFDQEVQHGGIVA